MNSWSYITFLILVLVGPKHSWAQQLEYGEALNPKPIIVDKLRLEVGLGAGVSDFNQNVMPADKPLICLYPNIGLVIPLSYRLRCRTSLDYQVIGNVLNLGASSAGLNKATHRMPYLSSHVLISYVLSKALQRIRVEAQVGPFVARQLTDETVNQFADGSTNHNQSMNSSIAWNYGLTAGFSASKAVKSDRRIGIKLLCHQGLKDIRTPIAKVYTGNITRLTQLVTLSTYFSI